MPPKLSIEKLQPPTDVAHLNEEWIQISNSGDAPFNAEGCSITVARTATARPRIVATIQAGCLIRAGEHVRLVSGSAGKPSHGAPPEDPAVRNHFLFLKAPYLDRPGTVVRLVNRQLELCRAVLQPQDI